LLEPQKSKASDDVAAVSMPIQCLL